MARAPLAGMVVALGVFMARAASAAPPTPVHVAEAPPPAAAMSLEQAYAVASRLVGARRHGESLPYFRRMIDLLPEEEWSMRHDYANALQGAAMEGRTVLGLPARTARSSFESIELMRRAMAELDRAQGLASSPRAAASVHLARARQLGVWGLPWNALSEARAAAAADRTWMEATLAAGQWTRRISGPDFSAAPDADHSASAAPARPGRPPR